MECLEAQRLVSERLDREEIETAVLEAAKEHCRACPECGAYVRALAALRQTPLPEPPADLHERVMDAVRTDIAMTAARDAVAASTPPEAQDEPSLEEPVSFDRLAAWIRDPRHRRAIAAWSAAAAVVFVVAGLGAMAGVRQILNPTRNGAILVTESGAPLGAAEQYGAAPEAAQDSAADAMKGSTQPSAAPSYITVGTLIYQLKGDAAAVDETSLKTIGSTTSSLGGTQPVAQDVLGTDDPTVVYIKTAEGALVAFDRVSRTFGGRTYALSGGSVTAYGAWPPLPAGIETPANPDGSPQYVEAGTDSRGVAVYRPVGGDAANGIAVAPGTASDDPAAGNPDWTWWVPVAR